MKRKCMNRRRYQHGTSMKKKKSEKEHKSMDTELLNTFVLIMQRSYKQRLTKLLSKFFLNFRKGTAAYYGDVRSLIFMKWLLMS